MFDFSDQIVAITGATGSLGHAMARAFQAAAAKLVLVDRSADHLQREFPDLADSPDYYPANCADLTHPDDVEAAITGAFQYFGRIDVLVKVYGGFRAGTPLHKTPLDTWEFMLNLNARSVFIFSYTGEDSSENILWLVIEATGFSALG